ncbi:hypothetical protein L1887_04918 [Cichorium endivia]|nr:hypothetical protein L1887_04918 [Cichorium endivia]
MNMNNTTTKKKASKKLQFNGKHFADQNNNPQLHNRKPTTNNTLRRNYTKTGTAPATKNKAPKKTPTHWNTLSPLEATKSKMAPKIAGQTFEIFETEQ